MRTIRFIITVKLPDNITVLQMTSYIRTAIQMWRKGGDPDSPLFNLPDKAFGVKAQTVQRNDVTRR